MESIQHLVRNIRSLTPFSRLVSRQQSRSWRTTPRPLPRHGAGGYLFTGGWTFDGVAKLDSLPARPRHCHIQCHGARFTDVFRSDGMCVLQHERNKMIVGSPEFFRVIKVGKRRKRGHQIKLMCRNLVCQNHRRGVKQADTKRSQCQ